MTKKSNTYLEILNLGEELLRSKGYSAFSYHDIAERLQVKNAAIHYHFPLKEDLGVAVIQKNTDGFMALLNNPRFSQLDEWEQLNIFMDEIFGKYLAEDRVCLVGALSTEFRVLPEVVQQEFKKMTEAIREWLTVLLKEGKKKNHFFYTTSPEVKALMIISNLMAGLQLARVMNKSDFQLIKSGILRELKTESN